jgi:hypothetical protein
MGVIGKCPDCGWSIYDGHVIHRCATPPVIEQHAGYKTSISFGPFDLIVIPRNEGKAS